VAAYPGHVLALVDNREHGFNTSRSASEEVAIESSEPSRSKATSNRSGIHQEEPILMESVGKDTTEAYKGNGVGHDPVHQTCQNPSNLRDLAVQTCCFLCEEELPNLRYDCKDCSDLFCSDCYLFHPTEHKLIMVVKGQPMVTALSMNDEDPFSLALESHSCSRIRSRSRSQENNIEKRCREDESRDIPCLGPTTIAQTLRQQLQDISDPRINISLEELVRLTAKAIVAGQSMPRRVITEQGLSDQVMTILGLPRQQVVTGMNHTRNKGEEHDINHENDKIKRWATSKARRIWLPEDRQRLSELKKKGWSDRRIGDELKRSQCAIKQQWRKQS
jgi:hypothetical protein